MGYGTIIISSFGNREEKITIIRKIWNKFGSSGFISSNLSEILTDEELGMTNMNKFKHQNLVVHAGWGKINGKPHRMWKLTQATISKLCTNREK